MKDINALDIFLLSQNKLANYILEICKRNNLKYEFKEDNYLFVYGNNPGCLVAHLDTVHKKLPTQILKRIKNNKTEYYANEGLGADDRAGVIAALYFLLNKKSHALFTFNEEIGGLGVKNFVTSELFDHVQDKINIWIEYDRKGSNEYITYSYENQDVFDLLEGIEFKKASGTYSDVATLSAASNILGINISSGYYNPHRNDEYLVIEELLTNINRIKNIYDELIKNKRECFLTKTQLFPYYKSDIELVIRDYLLMDDYFAIENSDEQAYNYYSQKLAYIFKEYELDIDLDYIYEMEYAYDTLKNTPTIQESDYKFYIEKYINDLDSGLLEYEDFETYLNFNTKGMIEHDRELHYR